MELAELMVGRGIDASAMAKPRDFSGAKTVLSIRNLTVLMPGELVKGIDLDVKEGEILGIAGLADTAKSAWPTALWGFMIQRRGYLQGEAVEHPFYLRCDEKAHQFCFRGPQKCRTHPWQFH